ncbi:transposase [Massilia sp. YIM B02443]|uniref:REP-associated tyrosine transposase n=1 Tax=Massilia sp. YIM B02443 TaxID=3050127 RepID=UPI0025B6C10B|nr:transposase [Massilia sp. YIM B02443]MDN4035713.1 transposase [Massilia sp. YIM B02443]
MARYRRALDGTTYFFTVVAYRRRPILCDESIRIALRAAFERVRAHLPFRLDAIVLLPDHLHCIWTLPDGDVNFATRWSQIKHHVSFACRDSHGDFNLTTAQRRRRESPIWQRKYWEHRIRDEHDMEKHVDYIHYNPVKHGLSADAAAWPYSSFKRYVDAGIYPADWGGTDLARQMMLE